MSVFVIADLHLSSDGSKAMDVFGARWTDYMERIRTGWRRVVKEDDTVVIPGDISWALKLEDAAADFQFLESLPGKKLIGKGNHDFWWSTAAKMNAFLERNDIRSVRFLYNNAFLVENTVLCGTRGWFVEEAQQNTVGDTVDYRKMINREVLRLRMSLDAAEKYQPEDGQRLPVCVFLHFPPVWGDFQCREILDVLHEYSVDLCCFGHIHGAYFAPRETVFEGIRMALTAADYLNFTPLPLSVL